MRNRCGITACANPSAIKHYVDRGVSVCKEWATFSLFAEWALANGYDNSLSIDRLDSDKNYGPDNCRWATMKENLRSRKDRKLTMAKAEEIRRRAKNGETWDGLAAEFDVAYHTVYCVCTHRAWAP